MIFNPATLRTGPAWVARLGIRLKIRAVRRRFGVSLPLGGAAFLALRRRAGIDLEWVAMAFEVRASEVQRFESGNGAPPPGLRPLLGEGVR